MLANAARAHSASSLSSAAMMPSTVSGAKQRSIAGRNAVRAMNRDPGPAAHGDPAQQRDIGFGEAVDALDEAVFLAEKVGGKPRILPASGLVDGAHVAAGAEGPVARATDQHRANCRV